MSLNLKFFNFPIHQFLYKTYLLDFALLFLPQTAFFKVCFTIFIFLNLIIYILILVF